MGIGPTGSRCLLVTLVSSPRRVPLPPARTMPRMVVGVAISSLSVNVASAAASGDYPGRPNPCLVCGPLTGLLQRLPRQEQVRLLFKNFARGVEVFRAPDVHPGAVK